MANKTIYINIDSELRTNATGSNLVDKLSITYQTQPSWTFQINKSDLTGADVSDAVAWDFAIDNDYNQATAVMVFTQDLNIDKSNASTGKLIVNINSNTNPFQSKLGTLASIPATWELKGYNTAGFAKYCFRGDVVCNNLISQSGIVPVDNPDNLTSQAQVLSMLRSAVEYQFSVDGTSFHSTQTLLDRYYQTRYPEGEWSLTIQMPTGTKGDKGDTGTGEKGDKGDTGLSAYECAVANGFEGDEPSWLLSLKPNNGTDGKSAYQLALDNGFVGTEQAYLLSLNGKTNYQLAVDNGFVGTEQAYLDSLIIVGPKGADAIAPNFVSGSFTSASLDVNNILSISHTNGNVVLSFGLADNNGKNITLDDKLVTYENNLITIDFSQYNITGTWRYSFGGVGIGTSSGGSGDVIGSTVSTDENIVLYNGTDGHAIKDSGVNLSSLVPNTRTINGKALNANISLNKADIGLSNLSNIDYSNPANIVQNSSYKFVTDAEKTSWNNGALSFTPVANTTTVNGHALSSNVTVTKSDIGLGNVPNTDCTNPANIVQSANFRFVSDAQNSVWSGKQNALGFTPVNNSTTVNGHALTSNVTISASDVGLGNVTNVAQIPASYLDIDSTLTANSDSKVCSQKAVKTYVNSKSSPLVVSANGYGYALANGSVRGGVGTKALSLDYAATTYPSTYSMGASGDYSVALGYYTIAGGYSSVALGNFAIAIADCSVAIGANVLSTIYGEVAMATYPIAIPGDCQRGSVQVSCSTIATSIQDLFLNGNATPIKRITIATGESYTCRITLFGKQYSGACGDAVFQVKIKNFAGTVSLSGTVRTLLAWEGDIALGTPTFAITADNTNKALLIQVTPANATSTRWTANIEYTKLTY